jgi:hypothetical protein
MKELIPVLPVIFLTHFSAPIRGVVGYIFGNGPAEGGLERMEPNIERIGAKP